MIAQAIKQTLFVLIVCVITAALVTWGMTDLFVGGVLILLSVIVLIFVTIYLSLLSGKGDGGSRQ